MRSRHETCAPCQGDFLFQYPTAPPQKPPPPPKAPRLTSRQRDHWLRQWAEEARSLERRRSQRLAVAEAVAEALGARWPEVSVWLFGSTLGTGFHADSDLDLAVAGLRAQALIDALTVAEGCAMRIGDRLGLAPVALDLVRLDSLPPPWRERVQRDGRRLR
ncbi:MAG: polymerase beta, Nucleotidyltransferase [Cyanobacteriota bacterium]